MTSYKNGDNMDTKKVKLTPEAIRAIESVLLKGERVELIPTREGIKVFQMRREIVQVAKSARPSADKGS